MTESAPSRAALVARRWASLATAACVATASIALIFTRWPSVVREVLQLDSVTVLSALFVLGAFLVKGAWGRTLAYLGLKHFFVYPPLWLAGVTGAAGVIYAVGAWRPLGLLMEVPEDKAPFLRAVAGAAFVGIMVVASLIHASVLVAAWVKSRCELKRLQTRATKPPEEGAKALSDSWDKLQSWLGRDAAVTNAGDDVFGHHEIAQRIVRRLNQPREEAGAEQPNVSASTRTPREKAGTGRPKGTARGGGVPRLPSQAVVGALGSGKTTVRHLVEQELASDLRMVPVDLWPYHTPEAAVEGVLRSLIDAVAKEANVLAVRGLPAGYLRAMGSAGTLPSVLANLVDPAPNPYDTLASLDNLATAIGRRFVVWVEDLERFSASSKGDDTPPDALRMAPIWSLLFGLSQRRSITVITATVKLQARFDLEKVARFIEELPLIAPSTGVPIIRAVRQQCLNRFAAPSRLQSEWDNFNAAVDDDLRDAMGNKTFSLPRAVITLARTPRTLKQGLRRVWEAWQRLAGEIDFDDLLLMCLLREAEPDAFALVRDNWSAVAGAGYSDDVRTKTKEAFSRRFNDLKLVGDTHLAVQELLQVTFEKGSAAETLQGVRHKRYWKRFLSEPDVERSDSDQAVLTALRSDDDEAVLDLLEGPRFWMVEHFAAHLPGERALRLMLALIRRRASESPRTWMSPAKPLFGDAPGLIPLWRIINNRSTTNPPPAEAIARALNEAFRVAILNLHLVHEIEYFFVSPERGQGPLFSSPDGERLHAEVQSAMWDLLVDTFAADPPKLVCALADATCWTLGRIVWGARRVQEKDMQGTPFQRWHELAEAVLKACDLSPSVMLPQVAVLVTSQLPRSPRGGTSEFVYDGQTSIALFGNEARVLEFFRNAPATETEAEPVVSAVRGAALRYFETRPIQGEGNGGSL